MLPKSASNFFGELWLTTFFLSMLNDEWRSVTLCLCSYTAANNKLSSYSKKQRTMFRNAVGTLQRKQVLNQMDQWPLSKKNYLYFISLQRYLWKKTIYFELAFAFWRKVAKSQTKHIIAWRLFFCMKHPWHFQDRLEWISGSTILSYYTCNLQVESPK